MKMEEHFKESLNRAVANEPPVLDAWDRFEQRAGHGRRVRLFVAIAAATAVAVASVIVVPRLGTSGGIGLATQPPTQSPTPTQTADPNEFTSLQYLAESWILSIPQTWTESSRFEGVTSLQPRDVENVNKGLPTFVIDIRLEVDTSAFPPPEGEDGEFMRGQRDDGRAIYRSESPVADGNHLIKYRIDWTKPCASTATPCANKPRTLVLAIRGNTDELWDRYIHDAQLIVDSVEYSDSAGG